MRDWGMEQKWMSILLPLLLLYNDPFFPLSFLVNSWVPGMLDDLFQSVFLCALLLFWLCVYHGVRVQVSIRPALPEGVRDPVLLAHTLVTVLTINVSLRICLQPPSAEECMLCRNDRSVCDLVWSTRG